MRLVSTRRRARVEWWVIRLVEEGPIVEPTQELIDAVYRE